MICNLFLSIFPVITLNIFDDWWADIENGIKQLLIGGIKDCMSNIVSLLSGGMSSGNGLGDMVSQYISNSPAAIDSGLWTNISTISKDVVTPIALTIVAIVSVSDMFQMVTSGNNMRDFDTSIFFKWIVKTEIALTLVGNAFNFVTLVFSEGATIAGTAYTKIGVGALASNKNLNTALQETLKDYTNSKLLVILGLSFVTMIAVYALFVAIMVTLCSRTIEAVMYLSVAPIPMATFMNNEFRQVGNSWARGIFALAFQGFFIVVALAFFKSMFNGVTQDIVDKKDILFSMVKMCGYSVALIFTVLRTGQISKTLFSAH